jgi:hypothetical protein
MWDDVGKALPLPRPIAPAAPPERVFLIHATEESSVRPNTVIFAWPPPRIRKSFRLGMDEKVVKLLGEEVADESDADNEDLLDAYGRRRSELMPRMDGKYWAQDYAELMKHVELENKTGRPDAWGTFGKTSCTQRFQGGHLLTNEGVWRKIESVFIPYGKITFACFQTVQTLPIASTPDINLPQIVMSGHPQRTTWPASMLFPDPSMGIMPVLPGEPHLSTFSSGPMPSQSRPAEARIKAFLAGAVPDPGFTPYSPNLRALQTNQLKELTPPMSANPSPADTSSLRGYMPASGGQLMGDNYAPPPSDIPSSQSLQLIFPPQQQHPGQTQSLSFSPHMPSTQASMPSVLQQAAQPSTELQGWTTTAPSMATVRPQIIVSYRDDHRGLKRKTDQRDENTPDMNVQQGLLPMPYSPSRQDTRKQPSQPYPQQSGRYSPVEQPVLMRGSLAIHEQQEADRKKKVVEKEPLRPAVPPPDGIECCIQCGTKERSVWSYVC